MRNSYRNRHASAFLVATIAALAGGGAGAVAVIAHEESDGHPKFASNTPVPGSQHIGGVAGDPSGRDTWSVLTWRTREGLTCQAVGQFVAGRVGSRDEHGRFTEYPRHEGGACSDHGGLPDDFPVALHFSARALSPHGSVGMPEESVTLIWGIAREDVETVTVLGPDGERKLGPDLRGAFNTVYDGAAWRYPFEVSVTLADGTSRTYVRDVAELP